MPEELSEKKPADHAGSQGGESTPESGSPETPKRPNTGPAQPSAPAQPSDPTPPGAGGRERNREKRKHEPRVVNKPNPKAKELEGLDPEQKARMAARLLEQARTERAGKDKGITASDVKAAAKQGHELLGSTAGKALAKTTDDLSFNAVGHAHNAVQAVGIAAALVERNDPDKLAVLESTRDNNEIEAEKRHALIEQYKSERAQGAPSDTPHSPAERKEHNKQLLETEGDEAFLRRFQGKKSNQALLQAMASMGANMRLAKEQKKFGEDRLQKWTIDQTSGTEVHSSVAGKVSAGDTIEKSLVPQGTTKGTISRAAESLVPGTDRPALNTAKLSDEQKDALQAYTEMRDVLLQKKKDDLEARAEIRKTDPDKRGYHDDEFEERGKLKEGLAGLGEKRAADRAQRSKFGGERIGYMYTQAEKAQLKGHKQVEQGIIEGQRKQDLAPHEETYTEAHGKTIPKYKRLFTSAALPAEEEEELASAKAQIDKLNEDPRQTKLKEINQELQTLERKSKPTSLELLSQGLTFMNPFAPVSLQNRVPSQPKVSSDEQARMGQLRREKSSIESQIRATPFKLSDDDREKKQGLELRHQELSEKKKTGITPEERAAKKTAKKTASELKAADVDDLALAPETKEHVALHSSSAEDIEFQREHGLGREDKEKEDKLTEQRAAQKRARDNGLTDGEQELLDFFNAKIQEIYTEAQEGHEFVAKHEGKTVGSNGRLSDGLDTSDNVPEEKMAGTVGGRAAQALEATGGAVQFSGNVLNASHKRIQEAIDNGQLLEASLQLGGSIAGDALATAGNMAVVPGVGAVSKQTLKGLGKVLQGSGRILKAVGHSAAEGQHQRDRQAALTKGKRLEDTYSKGIDIDTPKKERSTYGEIKAGLKTMGISSADDIDGVDELGEQATTAGKEAKDSLTSGLLARLADRKAIPAVDEEEQEKEPEQADTAVIPVNEPVQEQEQDPATTEAEQQPLTEPEDSSDEQGEFAALTEAWTEILKEAGHAGGLALTDEQVGLCLASLGVQPKAPPAGEGEADKDPGEEAQAEEDETAKDPAEGDAAEGEGEEDKEPDEEPAEEESEKDPATEKEPEAKVPTPTGPEPAASTSDTPEWKNAPHRAPVSEKTIDGKKLFDTGMFGRLGWLRKTAKRAGMWATRQYNRLRGRDKQTRYQPIAKSGFKNWLLGRSTKLRDDNTPLHSGTDKTYYDQNYRKTRVGELSDARKKELQQPMQGEISKGKKTEPPAPEAEVKPSPTDSNERKNETQPNSFQELKSEIGEFLKAELTKAKADCQAQVDDFIKTNVDKLGEEAKGAAVMAVDQTLQGLAAQLSLPLSKFGIDLGALTKSDSPRTQLASTWAGILGGTLEDGVVIQLLEAVQENVPAANVDRYLEPTAEAQHTAKDPDVTGQTEPTAEPSTAEALATEQDPEGNPEQTDGADNEAEVTDNTTPGDGDGGDEESERESDGSVIGSQPTNGVASVKTPDDGETKEPWNKGLRPGSDVEKNVKGLNWGPGKRRSSSWFATKKKAPGLENWGVEFNSTEEGLAKAESPKTPSVESPIPTEEKALARKPEKGGLSKALNKTASEELARQKAVATGAVQEKVDETKAQIKEKVDEKVKEVEAAANAEIDKLKSPLAGAAEEQMSNAKAELERAIQSQVSDLKNMFSKALGGRG